jgi:cell division transport system permease protein
MIARLRLLTSEAVRSVGANLSTTIAATMTVLIGMVLLGLFIGLGTWVLAWSDHVKKELVVKVYFCAPSDVPARRVCPKGQRETPASVNAVNAQIGGMKDSGLVKSYTFVSKEDALARMKKQHPDMTEGLTANPFPDGLEIVPSRAEDIGKIALSFRHGTNEVQDVVYGKKTANTILGVAKVIESVFLVAIVVLLASSTMLIANTIRLSIFSRRREIEVMKLVGATNWFVRGPFMIEGLIVGVGGSLIAVILLLLGKLVALPSITHHLHGDPSVHALQFWVTALILLLVGLVLGAGGAGLTLRKFLQV